MLNNRTRTVKFRHIEYCEYLSLRIVNYSIGFWSSKQIFLFDSRSPW